MCKFPAYEPRDSSFCCSRFKRLRGPWLVADDTRQQVFRADSLPSREAQARNCALLRALWAYGRDGANMVLEESILAMTKPSGSVVTDVGGGARWSFMNLTSVARIRNIADVNAAQLNCVV